MSAKNNTDADFTRLVDYLDSVINFAIDNGAQDTKKQQFNSYEGLAETSYAERQLDNLLIDHGKDLKEQFLNNEAERKRVISETLDLFLATNHSPAKDSKHDPVLADLVRLGLNNVLFHSLEDTEQKLILNPAAADLLRRTKNKIYKSMIAVDTNLAVASILKSRMTDLQKLYNTNQFDLSKLSDTDLCVGVYNLMFSEKKEADMETRHRKTILVAGMISSNLPSINIKR